MRSQIITAAAVAALASTGIATAADAPEVSRQSWIAGAALVDIPGTGIQQGEWMGSKAKLVYRDVTLERGQRATFNLRAAKGLKVRAVAVPEGQQVSIKVLDRDYAGEQVVRVQATVAPGAGDGEVTGRVYAYTK